MTQDWGSQDVTNGKATLTHTLTEEDGLGDLTLTASYAETDNYQAASNTSTASIRRKTEISVSDILANPSETVTLHADVTYQSGLLVTDGDVEFSINGAIVGSAVAVTNGVAELEYTLPSNIQTGDTITAVYKGSDSPYYFGTSTSSAATITLREGTNVVVESLSANRGDTAEISATITDSTGAVIDGGTAVLYIDLGSGYATTGLSTIVSNGSATFSYEIPTSITSGSHGIQVQYEENDDYQAGSGDATLIIRNETSAVVYDISGNPGEVITLSALITGEDGTAVSSGSAIFTVNGEAGSTYEVAGDGTVTYSYTVPSDASGTIEYSVEYIENTNYTGCTSSAGTITVRDSIIVSMDDVTALLGDTITLEATVTTSSGTAVNEGTVTFTLSEN